MTAITDRPTTVIEPGGSAPVGPAAQARPIRALLPLVATRRRLFAWTVMAGLCYQALAIASSTIGGYLVGRAATGSRPSELFGWVGALVAAVVATAVARW